MKAKKIALIAGLAVVGLALFTYNKVNALKQVFERMTVWPTGISNIKLNLTTLSFKLDISVRNPTDTAFSVTGASIATLKRIVVSRNGKFLGQADVDISDIEIPAYGTSHFKDLPFTVSLENILTNILDDTTLNINELSITAVIEVLGQSYTISG